MRPKIICHMTSSVDRHLLVDRWTPPVAGIDADIVNGVSPKAKLIDEISVVMYRGIDGLAGVPSIFKYSGRPDEQPAAGKSLRHLATQTLDGFGVVPLPVEESPSSQPAEGRSPSLGRSENDAA